MDKKAQVPTFDEIRASIAETTASVAKIMAGLEKTEKLMAKKSAEDDRKFADMRAELGNIGHNNGLVAEEIVFHSLEKDMVFAGIKFDFIDHGTVRLGAPGGTGRKVRAAPVVKADAASRSRRASRQIGKERSVREIGESGGGHSA